MVLRNSALALLASAALAAPVHAQQVAAAPLAQVDSWGVGWLGQNDGALPSAIWSNTNGDVLLPLYQSIQPKDLSPAARAALRRVLLSRTKAPTGGAALVAERIRLIEQLGETANALELRRRFPETDWGKPAERMAAEFDLLLGKDDAACARITGKRADDREWMPVRAFCAALKKDFNAAGLIAEQLATLDEAHGLWLLAAVETLREPTKTKPDGRYATPFEAAVSLAAKLSVPANALAGAPGDLAAAIATNPAATLDQRRAAMRPALDAGRLKPADVLSILTAKEEAPPAPVRPASNRVAPPRPDPLAAALTAFATADAKPDAKAAAYLAALKAAENPGDARLAAAALADAIKALPKNAETLAGADAFARAALMMADTKQAADWRKLLDTAAKESQDAWALARLDLMLSYAGASSEKPGAILDRMIAAAPAPTETTPAPSRAARTPSAAEQLLAVRRIENTRALFLHAGAGRDLSPAQRALLATQKTAGRGVSDSALARIASAADQDADGEAALAIIALLGPDTSALSFAGLSDLLMQLRAIGMTADATAIALESLQVWKGM